MPDSTSQCPNCGAPLPVDTASGQCPRCLLGLAAPESQGPTTPLPAKSKFVPPPPDILGTEFENLIVEEIIGRGGMGAVYRARQSHLDRTVALKILPAEFGQDPEFIRRFEREAKTLARLSHQNIVGIYDYGRTPSGLFYFIMEYVEGITLRQAVQLRQLTPAQALTIVSQICEALQFAHDEGIVHRDIKPENILIDKRGRARIADFGLAKILSASLDSNLTHSQEVMGTPYYMAPEQTRGSAKVDHRADIYALGVVFYEMLTGELPRGRFAPPSQKISIDVRLDQVVLKTLEAEPDLRYQRAGDVKGDVEYITSHPGQASKTDGFSPTRKSTLRAQTTQGKHGRFGKIAAIVAFAIVAFCVFGAVIMAAIYFEAQNRTGISRTPATLEPNANLPGNEPANPMMSLMPLILDSSNSGNQISAPISDGAVGDSVVIQISDATRRLVRSSYVITVSEPGAVETIFPPNGLHFKGGDFKIIDVRNLDSGQPLESEKTAPPYKQSDPAIHSLRIKFPSPLAQGESVRILITVEGVSGFLMFHNDKQRYELWHQSRYQTYLVVPPGFKLSEVNAEYQTLESGGRTIAYIKHPNNRQMMFAFENK